MSGHSKWAQIKRQKGVTDAKRANVFTKLAKNITLAAKNGPDPATNVMLKVAIEKARADNMPKDNIQRAIDRAGGKTGEGALEQISYEAFGPAGTALIIETATDNKNRTVAEVKAILTKNGGAIGGPNSVSWMFKQKGVIKLAKEDNPSVNLEELQLAAIEAGADDVLEADEGLLVYTKPKELAKVEKEVEKLGVKIAESEISMIPKDSIDLKEADQEKMARLFEALEDNEDVTNFYSNADF